LREFYNSATPLDYSDIIDDVLNIIGELLILTKRFITVYTIGVLDITGGADMAEIDEIVGSQFLVNSLEGLELHITADTIVLIENQPGARNALSEAIQNRLSTYYYAMYQCKVVSIDPRLKNKINYHPSINYDAFLQAHGDTYEANKGHSVANFLHFIENFGWGNTLMRIPTDNIDDAADSFMQILAAIKFGIL
jgi:hypothetical protein